MKITEIETFHCSDGKRNNIFLQILTDESIVGVGEPYTVGPDESVLGMIHSIKPWFIGQDPSRIEWLLRRARNSMRFPLGSVGWAALSGIDHALWDIMGKTLGVPVYMLLGGKHRDKVRLYHGAHGDNPEKLAENGIRLIEQGYTALKTSPYSSNWRTLPWASVLKHAENRLSALRDAVGIDIDIGVDIHATLAEPFRAKELAAVLEPFRLMFIEEPVRPEHFPSFNKIRDGINIPVATGENLFSLNQFVSLIDNSGVDIIQPDLCSGGGLSEAKKIAALAEGNYVSIAPHNPVGSISTAVSTHFAASTPNFLILEYWGEHLKKNEFQFVNNPWQPVNGYMPLPTKPGLGMELNLEAIHKNPPITWNRGFPKNSDSSPGYI